MGRLPLTSSLAVAREWFYGFGNYTAGVAGSPAGPVYLKTKHMKIIVTVSVTTIYSKIDESGTHEWYPNHSVDLPIELGDWLFPKLMPVPDGAKLVGYKVEVRPSAHAHLPGNS